MRLGRSEIPAVREFPRRPALPAGVRSGQARSDHRCKRASRRSRRAVRRRPRRQHRHQPLVGVDKPGARPSKAGGYDVEMAAGVTFYTDNADFVNGKKEQDPIYSLQGRVVQVFQTGRWLAADATYYRGGRSTIESGRLPRFASELALRSHVRFSAEPSSGTESQRKHGRLDENRHRLRYALRDLATSLGRACSHKGQLTGSARGVACAPFARAKCMYRKLLRWFPRRARRPRDQR